MNDLPTMKVKGKVASVDFKGAGPASGEMAIGLEPVHQGDYVWMDTPRDAYIQAFAIACPAMWDLRDVEITYVLRENGDNGLVSIVQL